MDFAETYPPSQFGSPAAPPPQGKNWWGRNWKWLVPVLVLVLVVLPCTCCGGLMWFGWSTAMQAEPYVSALTEVQSDPRVTAALGTPVKPGWPERFDLEDNFDGTGSADLVFGIQGPTDTGTVYTEAVQVDGVWTTTYLMVEVDGTGEQIVLIDQRGTGQP